MQTGYLAALATLACWTVSTFIFARLSRLVSPAVLNKAALLLAMLLLGCGVCIADGISPWRLFTLPSARQWCWLGLSGILGKSVGDWCGFYALRILGARRRSMMTTLGPGFTWVFALAILGEGLNGIGVAAMLLTIVALGLLAADVGEQREVRAEGFGVGWKGYAAAVAGSALTGLAFILSKKALVEEATPISEAHATWVRIAVALLALVAFDGVRGKNPPFIQPFLRSRERSTLLFTGVLFGAVLGLSFSLVAITRLNATVAFTIISLLPVAVMLVSVGLFRKRVGTASILYATLAVGGALALVWRDALRDWFAAR